jgi:hypothetical protein
VRRTILLLASLAAIAWAIAFGALHHCVLNLADGIAIAIPLAGLLVGSLLPRERCAGTHLAVAISVMLGLGWLAMIYTLGHDNDWDDDGSTPLMLMAMTVPIIIATVAGLAVGSVWARRLGVLIGVAAIAVGGAVWGPDAQSDWLGAISVLGGLATITRLVGVAAVAEHFRRPIELPRATLYQR